MRETILADLRVRAVTELMQKNRYVTRFLKELPLEDVLDRTIQILYLYTRTRRRSEGNGTAYFTELAATIGHRLMQMAGLKLQSAYATRAGAYVLWSLEHCGLISTFKGRATNGNAAYLIKVEDEQSLRLMWEAIPPEPADTTLPCFTPFEDWTTARHSQNNIPMIKTGSLEVLNKLDPEKMPIPFDVLNKAQHIGWKINKEVLEVAKICLRARSSVFSGIWNSQQREAKKTKIRETNQILDIAAKMGDETFYHQYYYDFRGRKYPSTAYLHEQGSDLSRGLLMMARKAKMTEQGYKWLLIYIASTWGGDTSSGIKTDKLPLDLRVLWALDNEEMLINCANEPLIHKEWMAADKPWQFLAAIKELRNLRNFQKRKGEISYDYSSGVCVFIDGSNNGCQHLAALTKDEETASHVNLTVRPDAGDLYSYVAEHLWEHIQKEVNELPKYTQDRCNELIDEMIEIKRKIADADGQERTDLINELKAFREQHKEMLNAAAPIFWNRIVDKKKRRKIVKRNVMTIPYGGTSYGLGQQQIDDGKKHGIDLLLFMEYRWGAYLGRTVFNDCRKSLRKPMQLLKLFEDAGKAAELKKEFLSWTVPITHFPVTQYYVQGDVIKTCYRQLCKLATITCQLS